MGNKFSKASFQTTAITFGNPFAQVVFKLPLNQWRGPIESLEPVKKGILEVIQKANTISIDGQPATPILARADFVTLGPAGVIIRPKPIQESLDNGIIGLTLVYETPEMADEITIDWRLFSDTVNKIEATTTDPFGGATMILSPEENVLRWKSRLSGYRVPVIGEIMVEKQKLPVASARRKNIRLVT